MIFRWETEEEKLLRFMKIPPIKKMTWLHEMQKMLSSVLTKRQKRIRNKLKENRC